MIFFSFKFGMLQVRENEIPLRKWSGGSTAQLRTFQGTSAMRHLKILIGRLKFPNEQQLFFLQ